MLKNIAKAIKKLLIKEPVSMTVSEKEIKITEEKPKRIPKIDKEKQEIEKYSEFLKDLGDNFEQKRAVVSDSNKILVLAGAGSGKTRVLTKRFIHLVKNKGIYKNNILAVTFTNAAAEEMRERIGKALGISPEKLKSNVRTFHSFGYSILRGEGQFGVMAEKEQREIIEKIILELSSDEEIAQNIYDYLRDNILKRVKEKEEKYSKDPRSKGKPEGFGNRRINTDAKVLVRSKSERDIANFLTAFGLKWEYEKQLDLGEGVFKPDFIIEDLIYLEHWCYNKETPEFDKIDKKKYLKHRKWKEEQYKKGGKILISVEESEMLDFQKLQTRLINEIGNAIDQKLNEREILDLLELSPEYKISYRHFIDEIIEILNLAKSRHKNIEEIKGLVENQEKEKVINFYKIFIPVMERYEEILRKMDFSKKDFNDLIENAVKILREGEPPRAKSTWHL